MLEISVEWSAVSSSDARGQQSSSKSSLFPLLEKANNLFGKFTKSNSVKHRGTTVSGRIFRLQRGKMFAELFQVLGSRVLLDSATDLWTRLCVLVQDLRLPGLW